MDARVGLLEVLGEELAASLNTLRRAGNEQRADLNGALVTVQAAINTLREEMNAVPYMDGVGIERFDSAVGTVEGYRSAVRASRADDSYVLFEDAFRGPAERVTGLQRAYLELVAEHQPVLDIGCGRGEFLTLLRSEGIDCRGVEKDAGMVARCHDQGLDVTLADGNEYLDELPDEELGAVFCAQVIEHLTAEELGRLLNLAFRKLHPGGLFIAETVNPHSIPAMKTFWVDLTHRQPVFPEVALVECAIAGFVPAYVFAPGFDSFPEAKFRATSYAVVATRP